MQSFIESLLVLFVKQRRGVSKPPFGGLNGIYAIHLLALTAEAI